MKEKYVSSYKKYVQFVIIPSQQEDIFRRNIYRAFLF